MNDPARREKQAKYRAEVDRKMKVKYASVLAARANQAEYQADYNADQADQADATRAAKHELEAQRKRVEEAHEALANANAVYAEENAAAKARKQDRADNSVPEYKRDEIDSNEQAEINAFMQRRAAAKAAASGNAGGSKSMRRNRRLKRARKTRRGRVCSHKRSCRCRNSRK